MPQGGLGISLMDSLFLFPISLPHPPPLLPGTGVSELGLEAEPDAGHADWLWESGIWLSLPPTLEVPTFLILGWRAAYSVSPSCSLTLKEFTKGGPGCLVTGRPLMVSSGC